MINPNPNTVTYDVRSDFDNLLMSIHVQKNFCRQIYQRRGQTSFLSHQKLPKRYVVGT